MTLRKHPAFIVRWLGLLPLSIAAMVIAGCSTIPTYHAGLRVLPAANVSATNAPAVRIRIATAAEGKRIADFPGKKESERAASWDTAGAAVMVPPLLVFFWPDIICNAFSDHSAERDRRRQTETAMAQFQASLTRAVEQCFQAASPTGSTDVLELVYVAEIRTIGPAADRASFIFHGQLTLQSHGSIMYQDILRIDPRGFSEDVPLPECTHSANNIQHYADDVIPQMIQRRLPGLPWKSSPGSGSR